MRACVHAWERVTTDSLSWDNFVSFCGGLHGIQVAGIADPADAAFLGRRLDDVAAAAGHPDPTPLEAMGAVIDFFVRNRLDVTIISHFGSAPIVERFFLRETMALCTDGLMPGPGQKPHPRLLGSFPRALRMARELNIPLERIVYRLATLPLEFLDLESPVLRPRADASLVLFDADTVTDRNSFAAPLVANEGIDHVWVHGHHALSDGALCATTRPGRILL